MSIIKMRNTFSHVLRPLMIGLCIVFAMSLVVYFSGTGNSGQRERRQNAEEALATVNGKKVTRTELNQAYSKQYEMMGSNAGSSPLQTADLQVNVLQQLLLQKLKLSAAEKAGVSVGYFEKGREKSKMIDEQIEQLRTMASRGNKVKLSDADLDHLLSGQNPPTTLDQIRKKLDQSITNDELVIRKFEEQSKTKVGNVNDEQLTRVFAKMKVRHILVRAGAVPGAQAERKANEILKKLQGGADFASVAREYSDDTSTKAKGGEIGWMSPLQDKDLTGLQKGQLSGLIKSPMFQAYRIIQVEDAKVDLPKDFAQNKAEYRDRFKQYLVSQAVQQSYAEAQKSAQVDIKDPELKGYWLAARVMQAPSPAERDKAIAEAIDSLQKAIQQGANLAGPHCKLAELYQAQGNVDKAISELDYVLNKSRSGEGADLRIMLAKLYLKKGQPEAAKPQLDLAADIGYADPNVHTELADLFKQVGQNDRAAKEKQWMTDYAKRAQSAQQPGAAPAPATAPKPGG